jgi:hypothetical protein
LVPDPDKVSKHEETGIKEFGSKELFVDVEKKKKADNCDILS